MNKIDFFYAPYVLKLKEPVKTSVVNIKERSGFIIKLESGEEKYGLGDAAPFPEFGSESFEEDERFLNEFKLQLNIDINNIEESLESNLKSFNHLPSLKHGFEQALLNLICSEKNVSLNELLNVQSKREIKVNAVIGFLSPEESANTALQKIDSGYKTIKVKIGRDDFNEDYECIAAIRKSCGENINIRVDVNGKWNLDDAIKNLQALELFNLEYAEQPVKNINDFIELSKKTKIPLAADESIRSAKDAENFISKKAASVLILKPMMLGGLTTTNKIIQMAEEQKISVVITTSFESVLGRAISVFAASLVKGNTAHGLDTDYYSENDLASNPYPVTSGSIFLK